MARTEPAQRTGDTAAATFLAVVLIVVAIGALGSHLLGSSASGSTTAVSPAEPRDAGPRRPERTLPRGPDGVANLDPDLRRAVHRAATAAAAVGVDFVVESGWRSPEYQQQLLNQAVSKYGSVEAAMRWVATPDKSAHVKGEAVDIAPAAAAAWLSVNGAQYGLCQIYRNEPWHFELRPDATADGCPPMYTDPTQDPRMQP